MTKKWIVLGTASAIIAAVTVLLTGWGDAIFQRGNPLPYLLAAVQLDEDSPIVLVKEDEKYDTYITKRDAQEEMIAAIASSTESQFLEQGGRGFFFGNAQENFVAVNEIYLGRFLVWDVPKI